MFQSDKLGSFPGIGILSFLFCLFRWKLSIGVFDFVLVNFLNDSPTKFNFNPTSGFSNDPTRNDPSPPERHGELLWFHLSFSGVDSNNDTLPFLFVFLFAFYCPSPLVPQRDRRCWSLELSLKVVVVLVLYSSSLEPKLELSYPPSGDVGLPSWLIAFRRVGTTALAYVNPIVLASILPLVTKRPLSSLDRFS